MTHKHILPGEKHRVKILHSVASTRVNFCLLVSLEIAAKQWTILLVVIPKEMQNVHFKEYAYTTVSTRHTPSPWPHNNCLIRNFLGMSCCSPGGNFTASRNYTCMYPVTKQPCFWLYSAPVSHTMKQRMDRIIL